MKKDLLYYILLFFFVIYLTMLFFKTRRIGCGCMQNCPGSGMNCPCYRRRVLNEYFTPQLGTDFTSYLDQLRRNQLKFSKENYDTPNVDIQNLQETQKLIEQYKINKKLGLIDPGKKSSPEINPKTSLKPLNSPISRNKIINMLKKK
jgi:hypothetical protein